MEKAVREAKQQTSWTHQNKEFEDATMSFIERILASAEFVSEMEDFVAQILLPGRINSLAQTLLKCTAPGVPDTYQGSELWDLRLVDPDNRGPVDYEVRRSLLTELKAGLPADEIMKRMDSGLPKLWIIHQALHLRRERPEWFDERSSYVPLPVEGSKAMHVIAFLRADSVAAIAPRWNIKLGGGFGSTTVELPSGSWKNLLTGEAVNGGDMRVQNLLQKFPVALLQKDSE
jgi:(1->4)-alpha-D-glucan 1-alpha-D-glucosylmutase